MEDNIDKAKAKKEEEDQRIAVIVADVEKKPRERFTNQGASCEDGRSHEVEVVCTTPADECVSRPHQGVREACGEVIPDTTCATYMYETSGRTAASSIRGSTVTRRPSDRLREKMVRCSDRTTRHYVEQYKDTTMLDGAASSVCASGVSKDPQPSGKTAPPSISSASAPGAYPISGIGASTIDEEDGRNDINQDLPVQVEEIPIDAFVADEPVAAVAWDVADQQIDDESNDNHKDDDDLKARHNRQRAFLSVLGIVSVIVLVGVLVGVLISGPNNGGDIEIICRTSRIRPESSKGGSVPNEAVKLNTGMEFGQDLDVDGDSLIVAAREAENEMKVAYIFDRVKGKWTLNTKLEPNSFVTPGFPIFSVAICGNYSFVGQSGDSPRGLRSGSVYVYARSKNSQWDFDSVVYPDDGEDEDMFGSSIACDGKNLIVGAMHRHDRKEIESSHSDVADANDRSHDGSAYMLTRQDNGIWVQTAKLLPLEGNFQQQFGTSVAINGDVAAVGSDKHDIGVANAGSVHAYVLSGGELTLADVLLPENLRYGDRFGTSVDIDSDGNIIVGAKFRASNTGSAFIFQRQGRFGWVQEAEITASDGEVQSSFGNSVALLSSPGLAVIGAWKDSELHDRSGAAYVYQNEGDGVWNETIKLNPEELIQKSYFGNSVAVQEGKNDVLEVFAGAGPLDTVFSFELCV